ncbi:IS110 family transposase [Hyunsoonleella sp. 2307UL5-6]|uniref:IS110 family transposase n=1 Tax=Hyunsoonleella sp. 2307UL5-6 TaxID=3384768 RepID=UPI0039BCFB8C
MIKNTNYFGIDISKNVFDVTGSDGKHYQFKNDISGFKKMLSLTNESSHCVMESTGVYHLRLAYYLYEKAIAVSVENPLSIKRFIQMRLTKIKTDKSDSQMIYEYAVNTSDELRLWKGQSPTQIACSQIISLTNLYTKQTTALKNKLQTEESMGSPCSQVIRSLKRSLKYLKNEIDKLEDSLLKLVKQDNQDLLTRVESIPGIGRRSSMLLIVLTGGFERFNKASELCSFAGLTPMIRQSGSSIRSRSRISKMGNRRLRKTLFMCSLSAKKYNKACKEIFDRIVAKGKSKKVALIAVCNKLLKQAFALAKSGLKYDRNYRSVLNNLN